MVKVPRVSWHPNRSAERNNGNPGRSDTVSCWTPRPIAAAESRGVYAWEAQRWSADAARACHTGLAVLSSPQGADRSGASCARLWQARAAARGPLVRLYDHGRDVGDGNEHTPSVRWGDAGIRVWERIGGVRSVSVSISKSIVHPGRPDGR